MRDRAGHRPRVDVALVSEYFRTVGGIGAHVSLLHDALASSGLEVSCINDDATPTPSDGRRSWLRVVRAGRTLACLARLRPRVVHCHGSWYTLAAAQAYCATTRTPLFFTEHTWPDHTQRRQRLAVATSVQPAATLLHLSRAAEMEFVSSLTGVRRLRHETLLPACPTVRESGSAREIDIAGFMLLGHEAKRRGAEDFLTVVGELLQTGRTVRTLLGAAHPGDATRLADLKGEACRLGVSEHVKLPGLVSDPVAQLRRSAILFHPSYRDNMPRVVLEAMVSGAVVVAYDVGGIRELVADTALLVAPGDIGGAVRAIDGLLTHPDRLSQFRSAARVRATRLFSVDRWVGRHLAVYGLDRERSVPVAGQA